MSKDSPNYLCHFWNHKSFFTTHLLCIFLAQTLHTFYKGNPSKFKFLDFPLLKLKFTKFLMSFFKVWTFFSVIRDNSVLFRLKLYMLDLPLLALKFTKFLMSFSETRVSFSSDLASLFSVMRYNSSVLFHLNILMLWTNGPNQSTNFRTFNCLHEN